MNIFTVTSDIRPENLYTDKAIVTLGIDSGINPVLEVKPKYKIESTLCYHFLAKSDVPEFIVMNSSFLPNPGASYVFGTRRFNGWVASAISSGLKKPCSNIPGYDYWRVDIKYEYIAPESSGGEEPEPSEDDPITSISRQTKIVQVPAWEDYKEKKVVNSAGQLFNPPVMRDIIVDTFSISRKEYRNPNTNIDNYVRCVNSTTFWGRYEPWQVLIENINPRENRINNSTARSWDVTYEISINTEKYGWKTAVLDQGMTAFIKKPGTTTGEEILSRIDDDNGVPVSSPAMLDGHGWKNPKDNPPVFEWTGGSPFEFKYAKDLSALKIPNPYR